MAKKHLSRREFLVGAAGAGGAVLLAACAPQVIEKTVEVPVQQTVVVEKQSTVVVEKQATVVVQAPAAEVYVMTTAHAWEAAFEKHQAEFDDAWEKKNPGVKVKRINSDWSAHNQIVPTWAAANELPDIIYVHGSRAFPWNQQGIMVTIDDFLASDAAFDVKGVWEEALKLYRFKGKQFEIPYDHGPVIMGLNLDLFAKYKVDLPKPEWTMDDFLELAKKLTVKKDKVYGYSGYYGGTVQLGNEIGVALVGPWGGKVFEDDESKVIVDGAESITALKWWLDMIKTEIAPNPATTAAYPGGIWVAGQAAMFGLATWGVPQMNEFGNFKYDVLPWPKGPKAQKTGSFGSGYGITRDSKKPDIAWKYLHDYLDKDGMEFMWGNSGRGSPARPAAYDSYLKSPVAPPSAKYFKEAMDTYAETGHPYQTLASAQVADVFSKYTSLVATGKMSVEDCVANCVKEANPLLADAAAKVK
jgi:multiple sugar transport system substrate-binding protein